MYTRCIAVVGTRQVRALDCRLNSKKLDEPGLEIMLLLEIERICS
jgi:hypothetical protein